MSGNCGRSEARAAFGPATAVCVTVMLLGAGMAAGEDEAGGARTQARPAVRVLVQGGGGAVPLEEGAPPPPEVSLEEKSTRGRVDAAGTPARGADRDAGVSFRALSLAEGEGTVEIDGRPEVIRPGSRLGIDIVKAVSPGRLVLVRPSKPGAPAGETLVIVTVDLDGQQRTRVFWTRDPSAPEAPEVKQP